MRRIAEVLDWFDVLALVSGIALLIALVAWDWRLALGVLGAGGLFVAYAFASRPAPPEPPAEA